MPTATKTPPAKPNGTAKKPPTTKKPKRLSERSPDSLSGIGQKLAWVQAKITDVAKTGHVEFGQTKFDHFQEHGIYYLIQDLLDQAVCGTVYDTPEHERDGNHTTIEVLLTVYDADLKKDDPDWGITVRVPSEGVDAQDKGSNKALTNAAKYGYQKLFRIPAEKADDVEGSDEAHQQESKSTGKKSATKKVTSNKAAQLKAAATTAIENGHVKTNEVTAKLQGEWGVTKVADLTSDQAADFATWLKERIEA